MYDPTYMSYMEESNSVRQKVVCRAWGRGNGELMFRGYRVLVWEDVKFWQWMVVMVVQ